MNSLSSSRPARLWILLLACTALSPFAQAQTFDWINPSGGSFATAANWSPATVPGPAHTARFALNTTYGVSFNANANVNTYSQSSGNVTLNLNNNAFLASNSFNGLPSSTAGSVGSLTVNNGTFNVGGFSVGSAGDTTATLTLSALTTMNVLSGTFHIGSGGNGTVNLHNGADLNTPNNSTSIAGNSTGLGIVNVTGTGSTWLAAANLVIGGFGHGTLNVLNGGSVTVPSADIGQSLGSQGKLHVTGAGATFTAAGTVNIGGAFASTLATSAELSVGPGATVNLNGATNLRTIATLNLTGGALNLNSLTFTDGAAVHWSAGKVQFADAATITPSVLDLFLAGTHTLGANRTLAATAGTLNLSSPLIVNGGAITAPNINLNAGMAIRAFGSIAASDTLSLGLNHTIEIDNFGSLGAASFILNDGATLQLNGLNAHVTGFLANNTGVVQGTGRFVNGLNNGTGGILRARPGDLLIIATSGLTNSGTIQLSGGIVEYTHTLSNLGNGFLSGHGEFRAATSNSAPTGISNLGVMAFSGGPTNLRGDILNTGTGKIIVSGASTLTIHDDVTHNGAEIRTSAGSTTVIFGGLTGAGPFTGTGTVYLEGDLRPGNSPGTVTFGGQLVLAPTTTTKMELAGLTPGTQYDRLLVAGAFHLEGLLEVTLLDGFQPQPGHSFDLFDFGSLQGHFSSLSLPPLPGNFLWDDSALYTTGTLTVIPEPATLTLAILATPLLTLRRRPR